MLSLFQLQAVPATLSRCTVVLPNGLSQGINEDGYRIERG